MIDERRRDYYAGALVVALGVGTAIIGARYQVGTLTKMGPGFFPTALGVLMAILGVMIGVSAATAGAAHESAADPHHGIVASPDWRGWGCIIGGVLTFIVTAQTLGLVPSTLLSVFIASWGDKKATLKGSALLAIGVTIFGVILFNYILRVQIPIIRGM